MPVIVCIGHLEDRQKVEPMPQGRQGIPVRKGRPIMIQRGGQSCGRKGMNVIFDGVCAPDPIRQFDHLCLPRPLKADLPIAPLFDQPKSISKVRTSLSIWAALRVTGLQPLSSRASFAVSSSSSMALQADSTSLPATTGP